MRVFLCAAVAAFTAFVGPASAVTVVNGSMNRATSAAATEPGFRIAPDFWLTPSINTACNCSLGVLDNRPDTSDINNNVGGYRDLDGNLIPFLSTPASASSDGGTFAGLGYDSSMGSAEGIAQYVTGFAVGDDYLVSWEMANFGAAVSQANLGASFPDANADMGISVYLRTGSLSDQNNPLTNSDLLGSGDIVGLGTIWHDQVIRFTADVTEGYLYFVANGNGGVGYVSLDGVEVSRVPVPAGVVLLLSGLAGLGAMRRMRAT